MKSCPYFQWPCGCHCHYHLHPSSHQLQCQWKKDPAKKLQEQVFVSIIIFDGSKMHTHTSTRKNSWHVFSLQPEAGLLGAKDQCVTAQATAGIDVLQNPMLVYTAIFQIHLFNKNEFKIQVIQFDPSETYQLDQKMKMIIRTSDKFLSKGFTTKGFQTRCFMTAKQHKIWVLVIHLLWGKCFKHSLQVNESVLTSTRNKTIHSFLAWSEGPVLEWARSSAAWAFAINMSSSAWATSKSEESDPSSPRFFSFLCFFFFLSLPLPLRGCLAAGFLLDWRPLTSISPSSGASSPLGSESSSFCFFFFKWGLVLSYSSFSCSSSSVFLFGGLPGLPVRLAGFFLAGTSSLVWPLSFSSLAFSAESLDREASKRWSDAKVVPGRDPVNDTGGSSQMVNQ